MYLFNRHICVLPVAQLLYTALFNISCRTTLWAHFLILFPISRVFFHAYANYLKVSINYLYIPIKALSASRYVNEITGVISKGRTGNLWYPKSHQLPLMSFPVHLAEKPFGFRHFEITCASLFSLDPGGGLQLERLCPRDDLSVLVLTPIRLGGSGTFSPIPLPGRLHLRLTDVFV